MLQLLFLDLSKNTGINPRIKAKVDELLKMGLKNYKIKTILEEEFEVPEDALPSNSQLSNRRFYLKKEVLKDLKGKTLGGFVNWVERMSSDI